MNYLTIWLKVIKDFSISANHALFLEFVYQACSYPESKHKGWCYASKLYIADTLHLTPRGLYKIMNELEVRDLIIRDEDSGWIQTTSRYNKLHYIAQTELEAEVLNKVHTPTEQSSHQALNAVHTNNNKDNNKDNKSVPSSKFQRPTLTEVREYFKEIGQARPAQEAGKFMAHYESCGWVIGKNKPMKDWKAAAMGWKLRNNDSDPEAPVVVERTTNLHR